MIPDLSDPLTRRQWDLEEEMLDAGMSAYRRRVESASKRGRASAAGAANKIVRMTVAPVAKAIRELVEYAASGAPGPRHTYVRKVEGVEPELVAFLTVSMALNLCAARNQAGVRLQTLAIAIARAIEDETRLQAFARANAGLVRHVLKELASHASGRRHTRTALVHLLNQRGDQWEPWTNAERVHVGTFLVDLLAGPGLVQVVNVASGTRKESKRAQLSAQAAEWIAKTDLQAQTLSPRYLPMVVPPRAWTGPRGGGYLAGTVRPLPFVKGRRDRSAPPVTPEDAPVVYAAVNAVQATPWRVNVRVLEILREAYERGLEVGIPPADPRPLPAKPVDIETNAAARRAWKIEAAAAHNENVRLRGKRFALVRSLQIASKFADGCPIYFPHHLDFRGRLYAIPSFLSPQGADSSRALLEFHAGKPIEDGVAAGWLAIHGANVFGFDKVSLEDRISWVEERNELIRRTAADPLADLWWADADKPWCFLAWCFEWAGYLEHGDGYVSRIPIALDGSCNGLQHYSALLRDPVGGAATNLVPSDKPTDIYGEVAKVVGDRLVRTAHLINGEAVVVFGDRWLDFGIDRKLTKRPVMVLPYGGTPNSCFRYVEEAYLKRVAAGDRDPFTKDDRPEAVQLLAKVVWQSIGDVVVAARQAMDWLRSAARVATAAGVDIRWITPAGFPVVQDYRDISRRRVKTRLHGAVTFLTLAEETDKLDSRRQANGLPPNFVHSLDAAALCLTVELAKANGIEHYAMIHDSYGTHAADTEKLSHLLRLAFVEMYEGCDPLAELERRLRDTLPPEHAAKLPALPERGTLDLRGVLRSDFFFA